MKDEKLNNSLNFDSNSINNRNSKRDTINNLKQSNNENQRSDPVINHQSQHKRKNSILDKIMSISILKDLNSNIFY